MKIYYGTDGDGATTYVNRDGKFQATSNGEFGVGKYFWHENLPAAIITAVQYEGRAPSGWAVVEIEFDDFHEALRSAVGVGKQGGRLKYVLELCNGSEPAIVQARNKNTVSTASGGTDIPFSRQSRHPSEAFRQINANPEDYGVPGEKNAISWKYNLIVGRCAAAYTDPTLIQFKFANDGIKVLNGPAGTRRIAIRGVTLNEQAAGVVGQWTQDKPNRNRLYNLYFKDKTEVDLNQALNVAQSSKAAAGKGKPVNKNNKQGRKGK
jgi:hypothetical protein